VRCLLQTRCELGCGDRHDGNVSQRYLFVAVPVDMMQVRLHLLASSFIVTASWCGASCRKQRVQEQANELQVAATTTCPPRGEQHLGSGNCDQGVEASPLCPLVAPPSLDFSSPLHGRGPWSQANLSKELLCVHCYLFVHRTTNGLAAYAIARFSAAAPCRGLATAPQVVKKDRANGASHVPHIWSLTPQEPPGERERTVRWGGRRA